MLHDYKTPDAFRQALEARLRAQAEMEGLDLRWLRRQVAFERLLARVFHQPNPIWLLKGGYAMELRLQQRARTTLDIDLMIADTNQLREITSADQTEQMPDVAYDYLQQLASVDLGDFFQYLIARPKLLTAAPEGGMRCSIDCRLGGKTFVNFHVDIGLGDVVVGQPEWVKDRGLLEFAGIGSFQIPLLPAVQQIAEKFHAYTYPWGDRTNTRVKDLVDLILLLDNHELDQSQVREAIAATFSHRNTHLLPEQLPLPPEEWSSSFAVLADGLSLPVKTIGEAYTLVQDKWDRWKLGSSAP
jgi:hypothetical protein